MELICRIWWYSGLANQDAAPQLFFPGWMLLSNYKKGGELQALSCPSKANNLCNRGISSSNNSHINLKWVLQVQRLIWDGGVTLAPPHRRESLLTRFLLMLKSLLLVSSTMRFLTQLGELSLRLFTFCCPWPYTGLGGKTVENIMSSCTPRQVERNSRELTFNFGYSVNTHILTYLFST